MVIKSDEKSEIRDNLNNLLTLENFNFALSKKILRSQSKEYVAKFLDIQKIVRPDIIEIHNRPIYINNLIQLNSKLVLYFHNDPLHQKGSILKKERIDLLKKTRKIIFISNWVKNRFFSDIKHHKKTTSNYIVIPHSINKVKIDLNKKKNLIIFVGRLNSSKGYDIFGKAILEILTKHNDWKAIVYGDEPREKITFKHKNLKVLGFKKHKEILNRLKLSNISVVCSRWEEPFGRTALEASSRGCAVIISNRGGLPEAASFGIKINNLNSKNLYKAIDKLILDKKYRKKIQIKTLKNFIFSNEYISKKIDTYRQNIILS